MKLQTVDKTYRGLNKWTYKITHNAKETSITINQFQGGTLYLTLDEAETLVCELNQLIDEVKLGQKEEFNENP